MLDASGRRRAGIRTHVLLMIAVALVITVATSVSLLLVRHRLQKQITDDLASDLNHSVITFQELQAVRFELLERENALLADLPTLKALMTSSDDLTIQDGAVEFWSLSGDDLFALADSHGRVIASYTKTAIPDPAVIPALDIMLANSGKRYLISDKALYACSVRPLYFGEEGSGTLLGYVVTGVSLERTVRQISLPTSVEASFMSTGAVLATTLDPGLQEQLIGNSKFVRGNPRVPATVTLGATRFLATTEDLSEAATSPLQLVVLKSFQPAERSIMRIDRLVLIAGMMALVVGITLMVAFSRVVTRPLEQLAAGVRAFGEGDNQYRLPAGGTQEVRQLSRAVESMRGEIQQANRALLEAERLATIGRMASSVSHDLRHYLAAVYANAEFLASDRLSADERAEIFEDIRNAVDGTAEMIESLLTFSRTGKGRSRTELMTSLVERAALLVRAHPDAEGVHVVTYLGNAADCAVCVEGKQVERAIYNLLLNACQSVRATQGACTVTATLEVQGPDAVLTVVDDGAGVREAIRDSLFEPFVSEGKQKGTGLGLTLAHTIATEYGGEVLLISSRCGETIFRMRIPREHLSERSQAGLQVPNPAKV